MPVDPGSAPHVVVAPDDGRVVRVELTAAGRELMPAVRRAWSAAEGELLERLPEVARSRLGRALEGALADR